MPRQTRAKTMQFDDRMSKNLHIALVNFLQATMRPDACTGNQRTVGFLRTAGVPIGPAVVWLREHGAHCDCEVVLHTVPRPKTEPETPPARTSAHVIGFVPPPPRFNSNEDQHPCGPIPDPLIGPLPE